MKKGIKNIIGLSVLTGVTATAIISSSFAWFNTRAKLNDNSMFLGSSIGAYFGGGDGSQGAPYIISTSTHVYNLAWLQYLGFFNEDKTKVVDGETVAGTDDTVDKQFYFSVANDIAMEGMYIPPIGTETYPFVGNFNGNNHVISDFTTSNILGENHISKKPSVVNSLSGVDIIGFFGVVGNLPDTNLDYTSSINSIYNFGLDDFEIEVAKGTNGNLVGLAAGYLNGSIAGVGIGESSFNLASGITAIANSKIDSAKTTSNISDYGLVGYCTAGQLKNTKVVSIDANEPKVRKKSNTGIGANEGASIPMSAIYTRLNALRTAATRVEYISGTYRYFDSNNNVIDELTENVYSSSPNVGSYRTSNNNTNYYYYEDIDTQDTNGMTFASYSFARRVDSNGTYQDTDWIYISGSDEVTVTNGKTYYDYKYKNMSSVYIYKTSGGTSHYLTINGTTGITDSTSSNSATKWVINNGRIYTVVNGTSYYLTRSGTTGLTVSTEKSSANAWKNANNVYVTTNGSNVYYLRYNGGWGLSTLSSNYYTTDGYYISDGNGNYLSANSNYNGFTNQTSQSSATLWTIENNYVYVTYNYRSYYVRSSARNGSTTLALSNSTDYRYTVYNTNQLSYKRNGSSYSRYYVYYDGSNWAATTTSTNLSIDIVATPNTASNTYTVSTSNAGNISARSETPDTSTANSTYKTKDTYFPLKYTNNDTDAAIGNIGYVVGGSRFFDSSQMISDMRVSRYNTSSLSATFGQSTYSNNTRSNFKVLTKTYKTYNNTNYSSNNYFAVISDSYNNGTEGGNVSINNTDYKYAKYATIGLTKYGEARDDLDTTWKSDGGNIYGLHFMNAAIDKTEKISVDKAVINNYTYIKENDGNYHQYETVNQTDTNGNVITDNNGTPLTETKEVGLVSGAYEMPKDCIDFNLAENATINFFAGSFFSGNNAFFSLHRIFRDNTSTTTTIDDEEKTVSNKNKITDVKEIHYVYKNTAYDVAHRDLPRYIYLFTDGSYGYGDSIIQSGSMDSSLIGEMLFDTDWIKGATGSEIISNASYYFEIPAVKGEYALGSINGKIGAYLMYLDIGASDLNDDVITVTEKINILTDFYSHPKGVDFCVLPLGENQTLAAIITSDTVGTVVVPTGVYGADISFSLEETTNNQTNITSRVLTCGPPASGSITQSTYIGDNVTITYNSTPLTAIVASWSNDERNITTNYTYNKDELALVIETISTSLVTTNLDSTGTQTGSTTTSDPIPLTEEEYDTEYRIEVNEATGLTDYATLRYYVLGDSNPTVACKYTCTHSDDSYLYTYEFEITTTASIAVHVDSLITSITQSSNVEIYALKINGTVYTSGQIAIISAS